MRCGSPWSATRRCCIQAVGPQHPDRPGLVGARLAVFLSSGRGGSTRRASPSRTCRRSTWCWSATTTTTISTSPPSERLNAGARPADRHAARQRHDHRRRAVPDATISAHDWGDRRGPSTDERHGPCRAGASLVGARHARPPHGAVGRLRDRDAGRQDLFRRRHRLSRRHATIARWPKSMAASASPCCRSAPTSRAGSWRRSTRTRRRRCEGMLLRQCRLRGRLPLGHVPADRRSRSRNRATGCSRLSTPRASHASASAPCCPGESLSDVPPSTVASTSRSEVPALTDAPHTGNCLAIRPYSAGKTAESCHAMASAAPFAKMNGLGNEIIVADMRGRARPRHTSRGGRAQRRSGDQVRPDHGDPRSEDAGHRQLHRDHQFRRLDGAGLRQRHALRRAGAGGRDRPEALHLRDHRRHPQRRGTSPTG